MPPAMRRIKVILFIVLTGSVRFASAGDIIIEFEPDPLNESVVELALDESTAHSIVKIQSVDGLNNLNLGDMITESLRSIQVNPNSGIYDNLVSKIEPERTSSKEAFTLEAVEIREIDLGRTRETPFGSSSEHSGIFVVSIRLRSTTSYTSCRVSFLHTGEILVPTRRKMTATEKEHISDVLREAKRDSQ